MDMRSIFKGGIAVRTEAEMMRLVLDYANNDDRIRVVGMEGSRTNANVEGDMFQDYDITYIVTDMSPFINSEEWLNVFGERIFTQKPEAMKLFYPQLGNWFSYLMLFDDGTKMDLTIIPLDELDLYLTSDSLIKVLLDKDQRIINPPEPSEEYYYIQLPSFAEFDDCCNEFWWVSTYAVKGICRKQFIHAAGFIHRILRRELLRMISWKIAAESVVPVNLGANYRYLEEYVSPELWQRLISTYRLESYEQLWNSLFECQKLFRKISKQVADSQGFHYPDYDEKITAYIEEIYQNYNNSVIK